MPLPGWYYQDSFASGFPPAKERHGCAMQRKSSGIGRTSAHPVILTVLIMVYLLCIDVTWNDCCYSLMYTRFFKDLVALKNKRKFKDKDRAEVIVVLFHS